jgi:large subunit ribosomal protein L29
MKPKDIRDLSDKEIAERIREELEALRHQRFQHAIANVENPTLIRTRRREIARLKTILNQRQEKA